MTGRARVVHIGESAFDRRPEERSRARSRRLAENPLESAVLASGIVPIAMLEGYAPVYSRAVLTATRLGIFDAISEGAAVCRPLGCPAARAPGEPMTPRMAHAHRPLTAAPEPLSEPLCELSHVSRVSHGVESEPGWDAWDDPTSIKYAVPNAYHVPGSSGSGNWFKHGPQGPDRLVGRLAFCCSARPGSRFGRHR